MEIVFATNNLHKLEEIRAILGTHITVLGLKDLQMDEEIPEDFETLEENALQKARFIHGKTGKACFADDTGLEVDALEGAPGVYSARYARMGHPVFPDMEPAEGNIKKLLIALEGVRDRHARFRTVIALIIEDKEYLFEGEVKGHIISSPSGAKGFGYDPVFQPFGYQETFAEMELEEKNRISHRARAVKELSQFLIKM